MNPLEVMQQFQTFCTNFQKMQKDPRQAVQELLNSGQMTQAQYNQLSQQAKGLSQMLGIKPQ